MSIELENLHKRLGDREVLRGVSLSIASGAVIVILGPNGSGKSTLLRLLAGIWEPDEGQIRIHGSTLSHGGTAARALLGYVPDTSDPLPDLLVAELCSLVCALKQAPLPSVEQQQQLGVHTYWNQRLGTLSFGQRKRACLLAALIGNPKLLILDEPTAALTERESEALLSLLSELRREGQSILYISHRLDEVMAIADHITVLRDGQSVFSAPAAETTQELLVHKMVGRALGELFPVRAEPSASRELLLEVRSLSVAESAAAPPRLSDVSLDLHAGEIVGIYGLLGAGRSELLLHLFGAWGFRQSGSVRLNGKPHAPQNPSEAIAAGLLLVTEDRRRFGLVMDESVRFNLTLSSLASRMRHGLIDEPSELATVQALSARLRIRAQHPDQAVRTLSGGNQQKVVLGKALLCQPKVVLLDEPTRGVDVGAKQEIYALLDELRREGMGVLMVSSDLPELLGMSDRVLVLADGTLKQSLAASDATPEVLLHAAIGPKPATNSAEADPR